MKIPMYIIVTGLFILMSGCGVKGNPLPPEEPRELGFGRPKYEGASKKLMDGKSSEEDKKKKRSNP